ncbi:MAG: hypothetical protein EXR77_08415 [Myxococcales bacterium]|nr:hypothetical protein [Myxococcales bacterium]
MGRCCGGKNAGKPISWGRYAAGLGVFCTYHGAIGAVLHVAAVPVPALRKVRDFHWQVATTDLREILRRRDINVGDRPLTDASDEPACDVPPAAS